MDRSNPLGGNPLGGYLRARRELVRPEDVGLPAFGRRRTPGLRREELALLAGISTDYYLRLEQGRDQHPSGQVLDALARVLRLDAEATDYLHRLANRSTRRRAPRRAERLPAGVSRLMTTWSGTPAYIQGRYGDVLAANRLATALSPIYTPGVNLLRAVFLDPSVQALYPDWEAITVNTVAGLHAMAGPDVDDPVLTGLVGDLSVRSERFRRLWARHDVRSRVGGGTSRLDHPQVGPLELRYEKLAVTGGDGQTLVVYHAEPGSVSEQALILLAGIADLEGPARPERAERPGRTPPARPQPAR